MKRKDLNILGILLVFIFGSCSMEPEIADQADTTLKNVDDMRVLMDGAYYKMVNHNYWGRNMLLVGEVRSDNTFSNGRSNRYVEWSKMDLLDTDTYNDGLFNYAYGTVAGPNVIINADTEGIFSENHADMDHIIGEAYALRALAHFDLLRVYGQAYITEGSGLGIPYMTEFRGEQGNNVPRHTVAENKNQLYNDIEEAIHYLSRGSSSEFANSKSRISLDAAYALQSRIGIYFKDYDYALQGSSQIVDKYPITAAGEVLDYWAMSTPGAASIFELEQNPTDNQGQNNIGYIYRGLKLGDVEVFPNLFADAGFDANDVRFSHEMIHVDNIGLRNFGKYPADDESGHDNIKVFRIEEVVLNHAESLLMGSGNDAANALKYLNSIPQNRHATTYSTATIENILKERRKELLFEGFRLYDLARYNLDLRDVDPSTINNHGFVPAGDKRMAMPIPRHEMDSNKQMVQNPGY